jgi:hypothetical protein
MPALLVEVDIRLDQPSVLPVRMAVDHGIFEAGVFGDRDGSDFSVRENENPSILGLPFAGSAEIAIRTRAQESLLPRPRVSPVFPYASENLIRIS